MIYCSSTAMYKIIKYEVVQKKKKTDKRNIITSQLTVERCVCIAWSTFRGLGRMSISNTKVNPLKNL